MLHQSQAALVVWNTEGYNIIAMPSEMHIHVLEEVLLWAPSSCNFEIDISTVPMIMNTKTHRYIHIK